VIKHKYYVVWRGRKKGIFGSWVECERNVKGYVGAQYKAFGTRQEAERAFARSYADFQGKAPSQGKWKMSPAKPVLPSICVDAAADGAPGNLEFRGVKTETAEPIFRVGPFRHGTNNVGEFLAIVEGMRWVGKRGLDWPIYSDSENAIAWVKAGKCNTKLRRTPANAKVFEKIAEAEDRLREGRADAPSEGSRKRPVVLKWDTGAWGENPADFGRK
jgi:ribonuclease HI